jgi:hypothetical protein
MNYYIILFIMFITLLSIILIKKNKNKDTFVADIQLSSTLKEHIDTSNIRKYQLIGGKAKCYSCENDAYLRSCGNSCSAINTRPLKFYINEPMKDHGHPKMGYIS